MQAADICVAAAGKLLRLSAGFNLIKVNFSFTGAVAYPCYPFAVGAPVGAAVVGSGGAAQVARDSLACRNVEYFAPGCRHHPGAVGREGGGTDTVSHRTPLDAGLGVVGTECHGHLDACTSGGVEAVYPSAVLEHYGMSVGARELDVKFLEISHFLCFTALDVIAEQVHRHVPVGSEEDLVPYPHGEDVLRVVIGYVGNLLGLGVPYPDIVGHAAAVILPRAEFAHHPVVGQFLAVWRPAAESSFGKGNLRRHASIGRHCPELALEAFAYTVSVHYVLAVGSPAHYNVVGTHTVAEIVAAVGRSPCKPLRLTSFGWNAVNLPVAVVLAGESNGLAVGGVASESLEAKVRSKAPGLSAFDRYSPEVSGISKYDFVPVGGGKTQQTSIVLGGRIE